MPTNAAGIDSIESPHSVDATVSRLKTAIAGKGMILFAEIDHAAGARQAGLQMPEARVLVFGHPKGGTPLMVATPLLALDLPLRVLVWEDANKKVRVSFTTTEFLAQRHGLSVEALATIAGVPAMVKAALA